MHSCPVEGCWSQPQGEPLCRRHWGMVPRELRDRIGELIAEACRVVERLEDEEVAMLAAEAFEPELLDDEAAAA